MPRERRDPDRRESPAALGGGGAYRGSSGAVARTRRGGGGYAGELRAGGRHAEIAGRHDRGGRWRRVPAQVLRCGGEVPAQCGAEDRKSTRLNSSHVAISYAV